MDPIDFLPLIGVVMLAGTTILSIAGAYVLGKSRRSDLTPPAPDLDLLHRVDRVERMMEALSVEMERVGEGQRFVIRMLGEQQQVAPRAERGRGPERIITPH